MSSTLAFELDSDVNTANAKVGQTFRAHLVQPIVLGGVTVAPAGTPVVGEITYDQPASAPDDDGYMSVRFDALELAGGQKLPVRPLSAVWNIHVTAGQESTAEVTDTLKDILIPYHYLYRQFRKGSNLDLKPGTVVHALTMGTVRLVAGKPEVQAIAAPLRDATAPYTSVTPIPLITPKPLVRNTPKPSPAPTTAPSPTGTP